MGYYTNYALSYEWEEEPTEEQEIDLEKVLDSEDFCDYSPLMSFISGDADNCKWYDHDLDMRRLSLLFPTVLFTLHGVGEENEDIWYKYYKNGKAQECYARIEFDEYNPDELKDIENVST